MKSHLAVEECVSVEFPFARWLALFVVAVFMLPLGSQPAEGAIHYVNLSNSSPASPFTSWASAATNIQHAIDAAVVGDEVLVTNGIYATGGRLMGGLLTNRVVVDKAILLRSVNGPAVTAIQGFQVEGTTNGDAAIRCLFLTAGSGITGFTLTNGATRTTGGEFDTSGGGLFCVSMDATVSNCYLFANSAMTGGGARWGRLTGCVIAGNRASEGGGTLYSASKNCLLIRNLAGIRAGGAAVGWEPFISCTVVGNSAGLRSGGIDVPSESGPIVNCIIYYNEAPSWQNCGGSTDQVEYSCTYPMPPFGNHGVVTNEPAFVDLVGGNFRLRASSPCIDAGIIWGPISSTDMDGRVRIAGETIDIGAYEYQGPGMSEFIGWLARSGLPSDGSADASDSDGDQANSWQEWRAGTEPTNPQSVLRMLVPVMSGAGAVLTWESVPGRSYTLERGIDFGAVPSFLPIFSNVVSQGATTTVTDTNAAGIEPKFYRVGVE